MKLLKLNYLFILVLPALIACPKSMNRSQTQEALKSSVENESPDVQERVSKATNQFTSVDPNNIVDHFVKPCTTCSNKDMQGQAATSGDSSNLSRNFTKLGGSSTALRQALCFMNKHKNTSFRSGAGGRISFNESCKFIINDYTKASSKKRMFIVNKCTGHVEAMQVANGTGGIGKNASGSKGTPSGFFVTGGTHYSQKVWKPGIKLHGLQRGINDKSYARAVVMHRAISKSGGKYCAGGIANSSQASPSLSGASCGRSWGCPAVDPVVWPKVYALKNKSLVYNYSSRERGKGNSYCGDSLWI